MFYPSPSFDIQPPHYYPPVTYDYPPPQYIHYEALPPPQILEPMQSQIFYPKETIIEQYPPLKIARKVSVEKQQRKKPFFNLDNNPYLNGSSKLHTYSRQTQPIEKNVQIQYQTGKQVSIYQPQEPLNYQQNIHASKSEQIFQPQNPINQQSISHSQLQQTQRYPNQQESKILVQQAYTTENPKIIQSQITNQQQYNATADFKPLLSNTLQDQTQRSMAQSQSRLVQSNIHYVNKSRPGLSIDQTSLKERQQTHQQKSLRRSKIFD